MSAVSFATAHILRVLPRERIGRAIGKLADTPWAQPLGRAVVGIYRRAYDVALDECSQQTGWSTFDAFFTRTLREGVRPLDPDPEAVLSPADGRIESIARIDAGGTFSVKGRPYTVEELVGDAAESRRFTGGTALVVYLSPRDYHRVHAPITGAIRRIRSMRGDYYPVNALGLRHVPSLFCRNRRVAIEIEGNDAVGHVTVVMVVAMIVGRITTVGLRDTDVAYGDHAFEPPLRVKRGDEIGVFHLGSTAVVLAENRASGEWLAGPGHVRYGVGLVRPGKSAARLAAEAGVAR